MKIQKIISSIEASRAKNLARRNENRINSFVRIHDKDTYGDSYQQMHQAREIIANYAQRNGVSVDISKASRLIEGDETAPSYIKEYAADKINVSVQNILTGESKNTFVSANTEKHSPKVAIKPVVVDISGEDTQIVRKGILRTEDSFLRNLYRSIENLTNIVTGQKHSK